MGSEMCIRDSNSEILFGSLSPFSGAFTLPGDLAVDQAGNIVFTSLRRIPGPFGPFNAQSSVVQRILPSGELDTEFGLDGGAVLGDFSRETVATIFDSEDRLVVVGSGVSAGSGRSRFEFV